MTNETIIEVKSQEIKRLHKVCQTKDELLNLAVNNIRLYRHLFANKMSEEREKETDELITRINEAIG
jgi:hypothetical protein